MSKDLFNRYIWLVETIRRRGRITRSELDERWRESEFNDGAPLCRRTLYNYRNAIADVFNIRICVDNKTYEYYIEEDDSAANSVSNWMLNARALADTLTAAQEVAGRIVLEDVPSARENLGTAITAIRQRCCLRFDYHSYTRVKPTRGVMLETYFLRVFKQRWYIIGLNVGDKKVKTYALDRMKNLTVTDREYNPDVAVSPDEYFRDAFGIVVTKGDAKRIAIRTDAHTAHYLRDLPLHQSQQEMLHDGFSIFYYNMQISNELVSEIMQYGERMKVLEPLELRAMVINAHRAALDNYKE